LSEELQSDLRSTQPPSTGNERILIDGMQKTANLIKLGLILAALIIGAARMMDVPTSFRIFGYPGLAMFLFIMAGGGVAALVVSNLLYDSRVRKKWRWTDRKIYLLI
jgi:ubiquinone biosynthesis protein